MSAIINAVTDLVENVMGWVAGYTSLFFTWGEGTINGNPGQVITGISMVGLFCLVLPLVGLGIGIIRRLVRIRA